MSETSTRVRSPMALLAYSLPFALAALLIPALFLMIPSKQAQMTAQPVAAAPLTSGAPEQVVMTVTEWSFSPSALSSRSASR